ncbi:MAG TPA: PH domain-containing protein [Methanoregula sp.]|nr:PH domain-containing protein [Methanoregula sp.]
MPTIKFCPECGTRQEGTPKFCPECGTRFPVSADVPPQAAGSFPEKPAGSNPPGKAIQAPDAITLQDGEVPLWSGQMSWASNWLWLVLSILTIWFLVGIIFFLVAVVRVYSTEYFFSNQRIFIRYGILGRKILDIKNEWVTNYVVSQGIIGRILSYGDLVISTPGEFGGAALMRGVNNPLELKSMMEKTIRKKTI